MSHSSHSFHPNAGHAGRHAQPRAQSAAAVSRHLHRAHGDYTLVHGGRQVRIGPIAFWIAVGTLVVMAVWSVATGTYFTFSEAVLTRLIGRQAEMQFAYEDRIAELRAQVDRITSRQLLAPRRSAATSPPPARSGPRATHCRRRPSGRSRPRRSTTP